MKALTLLAVLVLSTACGTLEFSNTYVEEKAEAEESFSKKPAAETLDGPAEEEVVEKPIPEVVLNGDADVTNDIGLRQYAGVQTLNGNLSIRGVSDLSPLSELKVVNGNLTVWAPVESLSALDKLETVSGSVVIRETNVTDLRLPNLKTVGSFVNVVLNSELRFLGLEALEAIGTVDPRFGVLIISSNPKLPQCAVDAFGAARGMRISPNEYEMDHNDDTATCE